MTKTTRPAIAATARALLDALDDVEIITIDALTPVLLTAIGHGSEISDWGLEHGCAEHGVVHFVHSSLDRWIEVDPATGLVSYF